MAYGYIYRITNKVNGKVYIGQSVNVKARWHKHIKMLNNGVHGKSKSCDKDYLQRAWDKYGEDSFVFEIIDEANEACVLNSLEDFWINAYGGYQSKMTYNLKSGGQFNRVTKESKAHMSRSAKNRKPTFKGKKHTKESIEKMSQNAHICKGIAHHASVRVYCVELDVYFDTMRDASNFIGAKSITGVQQSCKSGVMRGGYHWLREGDVTNENIEKCLYDSNKYNHTKGIICVELNMWFPNAREASRYLGYGDMANSKIIYCCSGRTKTSCGYHWHYADEDYIQPPPNKTTAKRVRCIETGKIYSSMQEAKKDTGVPVGRISDCCITHKPSKKYNCSWEFVDEF